MNDCEYDLAGNIAAVSLFGVLQFLESSRQSGLLIVETSKGAKGRAMLTDGMFTRAACGHLSDAEALLAMAAWREGQFGFSVKETPEASRTFSVPSILMEAARLEDELERLLSGAPPREYPLVIRDPGSVPLDPLDCGLPLVFSGIVANPKCTIDSLERELPLAPIKIRLAVAHFAHEGLLRSRRSISVNVMNVPAAPTDWYSAAKDRFRGGVRVLVASSPDWLGRDLSTCVSRIAAELDAAPLSMSVAGDGPSFARIRPTTGGLLSLTFLPVRKKNRYLFQTFAGRTDIVLFATNDPHGETAIWEQGLPSGVYREILPGGDCDALMAGLERAARQ